MPRKNKKEYNKYMAKYMRDYRAYERKLIKLAKTQFSLPTPRKKGKKKKAK